MQHALAIPLFLYRDLKMVLLGDHNGDICIDGGRRRIRTWLSVQELHVAG